MASAAQNRSRSAARSRASTRQSAGGSTTPRNRTPLSDPDRRPIPGSNGRNQNSGRNQGNGKNQGNGQNRGSGRNQGDTSNQGSGNQGNSGSEQTQQPGSGNAPRFNYTFQTTPGNIVDTYVGGLVNWGNENKGNEIISDTVHGVIADTYATGIRMGQAGQYNDMFLGSLGKYQGDLENLRMGNTSKLMGEEANLARGLIGVQGAEQRKQTETEGAQERLNISERGNQDRLGFRVQGEEERLNIGARGVEERRKLQEEGTQQLRLRADARGAIRSAGSRFFG